MSKAYEESIQMLKEILGQVFEPGEVKVEEKSKGGRTSP